MVRFPLDSSPRVGGRQPSCPQRLISWVQWGVGSLYSVVCCGLCNSGHDECKQVAPSFSCVSPNRFRSSPALAADTPLRTFSPAATVSSLHNSCLWQRSCDIEIEAEALLVVRKCFASLRMGRMLSQFAINLVLPGTCQLNMMQNAMDKRDQPCFRYLCRNQCVVK
jgi:hypothetical protein